MRVTITFQPDGTMRFIDKPELATMYEFGIKERLRASRVEPVSPLLRRAFYWIRDRVRDDSPLAAFTRRWPCKWQVDLELSGGPVIGPFNRRQDAIDAEVRWLEEHIL